MCGISGFFARTPVNNPQALIDRMLDMIEHRGPDGRGSRLFNESGLGHVRLAIIDIDGGKQPMSSEDKRYWITYNGEIYNFIEIKKKLQQKNHNFLTNSDTEVLLKAFVIGGIAALSELRGIFSLAIWDNYKKEGFLIRDRYGVKPLFYLDYKNRLYFASEIKAILKAIDYCPEMNLTSLHQLMNFRYIPGEKTLFSGIEHLPPGHYIHWNHEGHAIKKWANDNFQKSDTTNNISNSRDLLQNAIQRQLVSDVQIGSYLSGGIDSATILALSVRDKFLTPELFPTFTIRTGDSPYESQHAQETANIFGVPNYQENLDSNVEGNLHRLIWHLEVPKINAYQSAMVARLASKHVKVALSGLGADEIYIGYNFYKYINHLESINKTIPTLLTGTVGKIVQTLFSPLGLSAEEFYRGGQMLSGLPDFSKVYGIIRNVWDSPSNRQRIYGKKMIYHNPPDMFEYLKENWPQCDDQVKNCASFELENKMTNDLLLQEDRLSMAFGLEVRVPFLDEDLAGAISSLSSGARAPKGELKRLMKETVSTWLPGTILSRPKSGFQVPVHKIFDSHLRPLAERFLTSERLEKDGLFNPQFVKDILQTKPGPRLRWHYFMLYLMIGTNIWMDVFQHNNSTPQWSSQK